MDTSTITVGKIDSRIVSTLTRDDTLSDYLILNVYRVYNDISPLESMKRILSRARELDIYSLHLKKHYCNNTLFAIVKNDNVLETIEYDYNNGTIWYCSRDQVVLEYIREYISIRHVFTGPLRSIDYYTLDHYGITTNVVF